MMMTTTTTKTVVPQVALRQQLALLAGNEPSSSFLELRVFNVDMTPAGEQRSFAGVRDLERAYARVLELAPQFNVYVGCAPRTAQGGTKDLVARAWCLWADCDSAESVDCLRAFRPRPSVVTRSSADHLHAFWQLRRPLPGVNVRRANRRLALALGADRNACDAARVLRPILSLNHKYQPAAVVECVRLELDSFDATDVVGLLPDDPAEVPRPRPVRPLRSSAQTSIDGLVNTVRDASEGNRNAALHWATCRVRDHLDRGELARDPKAEQAACQALVEAALDAGLDEREAVGTIRSGLWGGRRAA